MGFLAVGLTLASGLMGASAQKKAGRANRRVSEQNARIGRIQAKQALSLAEEDVTRVRIDENMLKGEQTAAFAGQGVDLGSDIVNRTGIQTEEVIADEIATIRNNARLKSWGLEVQAKQDVTQGRLAQRRGNAAATASILGGLTNAAVIGYGMRTNG